MLRIYSHNSHNHWKIILMLDIFKIFNKELFWCLLCPSGKFFYLFPYVYEKVLIKFRGNFHSKKTCNTSGAFKAFAFVVLSSPPLDDFTKFRLSLNNWLWLISCWSPFLREFCEVNYILARWSRKEYSRLVLLIS